MSFASLPRGTLKAIKVDHAVLSLQSSLCCWWIANVADPFRGPSLDGLKGGVLVLSASVGIHCAGLSDEVILLQVEKAWTEIMKTFPPPLYRHRYGT